MHNYTLILFVKRWQREKKCHSNICMVVCVCVCSTFPLYLSSTNTICAECTATGIQQKRMKEFCCCFADALMCYSVYAVSTFNTCSVQCVCVYNTYRFQISSSNSFYIFYFILFQTECISNLYAYTLSSIAFTARCMIIFRYSRGNWPSKPSQI